MEKEQIFTQKQVDRIVQERLERFKRKTAEELEQVKSEVPEGETDYKKMYEQALERKKELDKQQALLDVGFTLEQVPDYVKYMNMVSEDEYEETAKLFYDEYQKKLGKKSTFADPSSKQRRISKWNPWE